MVGGYSRRHRSPSSEEVAEAHAAKGPHQYNAHVRWGALSRVGQMAKSVKTLIWRRDKGRRSLLSICQPSANAGEGTVRKKSGAKTVQLTRRLVSRRFVRWEPWRCYGGIAEEATID